MNRAHKEENQLMMIGDFLDNEICIRIRLWTVSVTG